MSHVLTLDKIQLDHPLWTNPRTSTGMSDKELDELGDDLLNRGQIYDITVLMVYDTPASKATWPGATVDPVVDDAEVETGDVEPEDAEAPPDDAVAPDAATSAPYALALDGQRRILALRRACKRRRKGPHTVEVKVTYYTTEPVEFTKAYSTKLFDDITAAAINREPLSSPERLDAVIKLVARGRTQAQAGKTVQHSESWVSRMIRAHERAGNVLREQWRSGELTDEQFKDFSDIKGGDEKNPFLNQEIAVAKLHEIKTVAGGREAKVAARHFLKEESAKAKAARKAERTKPEKPAKGKKAKAEPERVEKRQEAAKVTSRVIYALGEIHKPMDPWVKGFMAHAAYDAGEITPVQFASAWRSYVKKAKRAGVEVPDGIALDPPKKKRKR